MAKNPEHRDLFPGALEIMILQSLRLKPMHGYALVKHIKQVSDDLLQVEEGSLYPALQRMLKEGWLEAESWDFGQGPADADLSAHRCGHPASGKRSRAVSRRCLPASRGCLPRPAHRRCACRSCSRFFSRNRRYDDISVSIQEHIDERIDELMEEGMPRDEAEQARAANSAM